MKVKIEDITDIIILKTVGASGSLFFHSLLDQHEEIINIPIYPFVFTTNLFEWFEWFELKNSDKTDSKKINKLITSFIKHYPFLLDSYYEETKKEEHFMGATHSRDDRIFLSPKSDENNPSRHKPVDKEKFKLELQYLLTEHNNKITAGDFIKAIHLAYSNAIYPNRKFSKTPKIVFDIHTFTDINYYFRKFELYFKNVKTIINLRTPSEIINSFAKRPFLYIDDKTEVKKEWVGSFSQSAILSLCCFSSCDINMAYINKTRVVVFEELHTKTNEIMQAVANFISISYDKTLLKSTFNGIEWRWYPKGKRNEKCYKSGFGLPERNDEYLSNEQRDCINFIFYKVCDFYGMNYNKKIGIKEAESILEKDFNFEYKLRTLKGEIKFDELDIKAIKTSNRSMIFNFLARKKYWEKRTLPKNIRTINCLN